MLRLYSVKRTERIVEQQAEWIEKVARQYGIPSACMKAVLRKEIAEIDLLDVAADLAVRLNWLRSGIARPFRHGPEVIRGKGLFRKRDSSTGYAQIFAAVAIDAANYAMERGLETAAGLEMLQERRPDRRNADDLCAMWRRLARDKAYNIRLGTLNLIAAAEEMNGHTDFARYTPEEYQRAFTRYNANVRTVTDYGREVYGYFLRYGGEGH